MKCKNLFLLTILVLLNCNIAFGYKYTFTNFTESKKTISLSGNPWTNIVGAMTPLGLSCLYLYYGFSLEIPPFSKKSFDSGQCCVPKFRVQWDYFDNGTGCKGADIYIHRKAEGYEVTTSSALTKDDLKYAVVQAATKEAAEMDAQAKSGDIKLKFMPLKHISVEVQNSLRKQNADAKATNKDKSGILHGYVKSIPAFTSIQHAELETAEDMITAGLLEDKNQFNETPLHRAIKEGYRDWVLFLIRHRADVFARDDSNRSVLHLAAQNGDSYIIQLLIKAAQMILDEKLKSNKINGIEYAKTMYDFINSKDNFGNTPFDYADNVDSMRVFLDPKRTVNIQAKTTDINKLDSRGFTKLINAIANIKEDSAVLDSLLKYPDIDLYKESKDNVKPSFLAIVMNKNFMRDKLKGDSPLEKLLSSGLDPKVTDKDGNNLWHIAAMIGDVDALNKVLARIDLLETVIKNKKGMNVLHLATLGHNRDVVEYLFKLNRKWLEEKDSAGKTPLDYAIQEEFKDLEAFFKNPKSGMPAPYETPKEKKLREEQSKIKK